MLLVVAALAFAFMSGANDGATLAATSARTGAFSPLTAVLLLAAATGAVPLLIGGGVATTLAHGLVTFEADRGRLAFLGAVASSLAVVLALSRRGLPTSLTLSLTGGIVGVGVGAQLAPRWSTIGTVLAAGLLGPMVSVAVSFLLARRLRVALGTGATERRRARGLARLEILVLSFAYGANDAEKVVALLAIATGASVNPVRPFLTGQAAVAAVFAIGALLSLRRVAARVTEQMVRVRQPTALAALLSASAVVFGGASAGMPLSSTQATTAGLFGGVARLTPSQVRWSQARSIGAAWVLTLPSSVALGALFGLLLRVVP